MSTSLDPKEVGYYKDLATGRILESWDNPLGDRTEVLHINNPVVNSTLAASFHAPGAPQPGPGREIVFGNHSRAADPSAPFVLPWFVNGDTVSVWLDVAAVVPNPLPPAQWPRESTGPTIRVAEQFLLTGRLADLRDPARSSVPTTGAWNRFGPWLPWMLMGGQPGELLRRPTRSARRRGRSPATSHPSCPATATASPRTRPGSRRRDASSSGSAVVRPQVTYHGLEFEARGQRVMVSMRAMRERKDPRLDVVAPGGRPRVDGKSAAPWIAAIGDWRRATGWAPPADAVADCGRFDP